MFITINGVFFASGRLCPAAATQFRTCMRACWSLPANEWRGGDRSLLGDDAFDHLRLETFDIGTNQWAKLHQQFEEGVHTDVVIRIRVAPSNEKQDEQEQQQSPSAKRTRMSNGAAAAAGADVYTDIKAHSVVLSGRSAYFEKALTGEWAEASTRRVELGVEDEQAVAPT